MNTSRILTVVNLVGVVALATLCAFQWRAAVRDHRKIEDMALQQRILADDLAKERTRSAAHKDSADEFRQRLADSERQRQATEQSLAAAEAKLKETEAKVALLEAAAKELAAARDIARVRAETGEANLTAAGRRAEELLAQLKAWEKAVAERDGRIKDLGDRQTELVAERNAAVQRHNQLVQQYNTLAQRLQETEMLLQEALKKLPVPAPAKEPERDPLKLTGQ